MEYNYVKIFPTSCGTGLVRKRTDFIWHDKLVGENGCSFVGVVFAVVIALVNFQRRFVIETPDLFSLICFESAPSTSISTKCNGPAGGKNCNVPLCRVYAASPAHSGHFLIIL